MNKRQETIINLEETFDNAKDMPFAKYKELILSLNSDEKNDIDETQYHLNYTPLQSLLLIARYPFLMPRNRFTWKEMFDYEKAKQKALDHEPLEDDMDRLVEYEATWCRPNYENKELQEALDAHIFNELDDMPSGWDIRFGLEMMEDINTILLSSSVEDPYEYYGISQIKEKYGTLRYYDQGIPNDVYEEIEGIVDLYEFVSEHTCIVCGAKHDIELTSGWISPYCPKHYPDKKLRDYTEQEKKEWLEKRQKHEKELIEKGYLSADKLTTSFEKYFGIGEYEDKKEKITLATMPCYTTYETDKETGEHKHITTYAKEILDKAQNKVGPEVKLNIKELLDETIDIVNTENGF